MYQLPQAAGGISGHVGRIGPPDDVRTLLREIDTVEVGEDGVTEKELEKQLDLFKATSKVKGPKPGSDEVV